MHYIFILIKVARGRILLELAKALDSTMVRVVFSIKGGLTEELINKYSKHNLMYVTNMVTILLECIVLQSVALTTAALMVECMFGGNCFFHITTARALI